MSRGIILVDSVTKGGIYRVAIIQAKYLKWKLVSMCNYRPWTELLENVSVEYLSTISIPKLQRTINILNAMFLKKVNRQELTIAHQFDACYLAMRSKVKYIGYIHDLHYSPIPQTRLTIPLIRKLEKKALEKAEIIISNSDNTKTQLESIYNLDSIVIEPTIIEVPNIDESVIKQKENTLLIVCRLSEVDKVLPVVEHIRRELSDLKIIIAGAYNQIIWKRVQKIKKLNIELKVDVSEKELRSLYLRSKAVLQPFGENFGLVPLEAAVYFTVPIIHYKCGVAKYFSHGTNGFVFKEPTSVVKYVCQILGEKFEQLAVNARENIIKKGLTIDNYIRRITKVLQNAR
ncbi:MAG: glycosyltransferase [Candidatus Njordarchaeales archaeon]